MNKLDKNSLSLLLLVGGGVALLLWLATTSAMVQVALGLLLVFVLPGYALTAALFTHQQLGWAERVLLAVGASLAVGVLGSLLIHQIGWTLGMKSWLVLFMTVTVAGGVGAWWVRRPTVEPAPTSIRVGFNSVHFVLLGLAVVVASLAFSTARSAAPAQGFQGYTILWMTPQAANAVNRIRLGIASKEFGAAQYKLQIKVNDQLAHEWPLLELTPNGEWLASFELPVELSAQSTVEAALYRLDQPETPYRHVVLRPKQ